MRNLVKLVVVLLCAGAFGMVFSLAVHVTFRDALLDFLDEATVDRVSDYLTRTTGVRAIGIAMLLILWTAIVFAIDRAVDSTRRRPTTDGPR